MMELEQLEQRAEELHRQIVVARLSKVNPCHVKSGPQGGQFCETKGGGTGGASIGSGTKVPNQPDATGKIPVPSTIASEGAKLAMAINHASNEMDGWSRRAQEVKYNKSGMRRSGPKAAKEIAEAEAGYDKSTKAYRESTKQGEAFTQKHGLSYVSAWEAQNGRRWPYYRVDSSAGSAATHYVKD